MKNNEKITKKGSQFKDSDGDGLSDYDEINIFGSDPHDPDTDGDGIEDGEAVLMGRHPVTGQKLKDMFIPYKGNNYEPQALKPKRVLFHAASALIVKFIILILVFFYPISAWMTPEVSWSESQKIINLTNSLRQEENLSNLTENQLLNQAAYKKVEDMLLNQYFAHTSPQGRGLEYFIRLANYQDYLTIGENLAMGFNNASEVVSAWKHSPTHYKNIIDVNFSEIGVAMASGPYLEKDTVFVAQYFGLPRANVVVAPSSVPVSPVIEVIEAASIIIDEPAGFKNDKVVKVEAVLPNNTATASLEIFNTQITLTPADLEFVTLETEEFIEEEPVVVEEASEVATSSQTWLGQALIIDNTNSITPPIITLSTTDDQVRKLEVSNNNIEAKATPVAAQYLLMKNYPSQGLGQIFNISSVYFKILLGLAIIALALNVFINIRKQNLKLIFSGLGIITLLILLIVF